MLKLFQIVQVEFESVLVCTEGHPLQHHLICLYPITDTLFHH